jgi:hypothetical protein
MPSDIISRYLLLTDTVLVAMATLLWSTGLGQVFIIVATGLICHRETLPTPGTGRDILASDF